MIRNDGYARPINARAVHLVLLGPQVESFELPVDPRTWEPGVDHELCASLTVDLAPGTYQLGLWLPDPDTELGLRPEYAIRLANDEVSWDADAGINVFDASLEIR